MKNCLYISPSNRIWADWPERIFAYIHYSVFENAFILWTKGSLSLYIYFAGSMEFGKASFLGGFWPLEFSSNFQYDDINWIDSIDNYIALREVPWDAEFLNLMNVYTRGLVPRENFLFTDIPMHRPLGFQGIILFAGAHIQCNRWIYAGLGFWTFLIFIPSRKLKVTQKKPQTIVQCFLFQHY